MRIKSLHEWGLSIVEAKALQLELAARVDDQTRLGEVRYVAGADISYSKFSGTLYAGVVVMDVETGEVVEESTVVREAGFPYVPGYLSFRETPAVLDAFAQLTREPDVVICDGQGRAHPRRFGLACHLGLWLDLPTIGCAKSRLCGEFEPPGAGVGSRSPLLDGGEVIGRVVRTRVRTKPLFVSSGHRCDLESAVALVLALAKPYRQPASTRKAHALVNRARLEAGGARLSG
jgi:deoxyribonuclease V